MSILKGKLWKEKVEEDRLKNHQNKERIECILKILSDPPQSHTISEIHQKVMEQGHRSVSRKTIERDISLMLKKNLIIESSLNPLTVSIRGIYDAMMHLSHEEITYLIVVLPEDHSLSLRLRKMYGLTNDGPFFEES